MRCVTRLVEPESPQAAAKARQTAIARSFLAGKAAYPGGLCSLTQPDLVRAWHIGWRVAERESKGDYSA
jgi:hypothetical protein